MFQSTRPGGARRRRACRSTPPRLFQSTRPGGARQGRAGDVARGAVVSIHAPRRGATIGNQLAPIFGKVSIHAPRRGATATAAAIPASTAVFQSTRPGGARRDSCRRYFSRHRVSIHAPRRGATSTADLKRKPQPEFQSTRPGGARLAVKVALADSETFQSTRPGGARLDPFFFLVVIGMFQSTRPGGARPRHLETLTKECHVSIHAPRRGATSCGFKLVAPAFVSIHAPRRGATRVGDVAIHH